METIECWKNIPDYPNYEVSDLGQVRSKLTNNILKPEVRSGYLGLQIRNKDGSKKFNIHQLVALAFIGDCPSGYFINHKDGVKTNNKLTNLEYVSPSGNSKHAVETNLQPVKKVLVYSKTTNKIINIYKTSKEASEYLGIHINNIRTLCREGELGCIKGNKDIYLKYENDKYLMRETEIPGGMWKNLIISDSYEVSTKGQVRNRLTKKILKQKTCSDGYKKVNLYIEGVPKTFRVHRLIAETFLTNVEGKKSLITWIQTDLIMT